MAMRLRIKELIAEKAEREGRELNQKIVAAEAGIDPSILSRYAKNFSTSFNATTLQRLKIYFNVSFDEMFEIVPDR